MQAPLYRMPRALARRLLTRPRPCVSACGFPRLTTGTSRPLGVPTGGGLTLLLRCEMLGRSRHKSSTLWGVSSLCCCTLVYGLPRVYLRRASARLRGLGSMHCRLRGLGSPKPSVVVAAYVRLGGHARGTGRRDETRHQQLRRGRHRWPCPHSPPGQTGPEHQATAPYHSDDMAWPPAVGLGRPDTPGAGPWPPCQQRSPPHTPSPMRVLALSHTFQDLVLKVRRGGRLE
jgi:hypothetical protein